MASWQGTLGLLSPHLYDVSISYAHDDNVLNDGAVDVLRDRLAPLLAAALRQRAAASRLDGDASIFMDEHSLPRNGSLTEELRKVFRQTAFLVIVIGNSYPASEWCGLELQTFAERFGMDRPAAIRRTIVVVLERDACDKSWGPYLDQPERPILLPFYDETSGAMIPFILEAPDGRGVPSPRFSKRMRKLVDTITDRAAALNQAEGFEV